MHTVNWCRVLWWFASACSSSSAPSRADDKGLRRSSAFYCRRSPADRSTMYCLRTTRRGEEDKFSRSRLRQRLVPLHCRRRPRPTLPRPSRPLLTTSTQPMMSSQCRAPQRPRKTQHLPMIAWVWCQLRKSKGVRRRTTPPPRSSPSVLTASGNVCGRVCADRIGLISHLKIHQ